MRTSYPDFGLTADQRRRAVRDNYYEQPSLISEVGEIWCYTDQISYRAGDTVALHVSSTAAQVDILIVRDGCSEERVFEKAGIAVEWQETPTQCSVEGCGWKSSFEFTIGIDWPSGAYRVSLQAEGRHKNAILCHHLFIVTPPPGKKPGRVLQIAATGTWLAYNNWGGSNAYQGILGPNRDEYAPVLSTQRPWCRGFVVLPNDAPRVPLEVAIPPMTAPRYPHVEWAYATGHSRRYAAAGWASHDSNFFRFAERAGYEIDLASQNELHFSPEVLDGYDCVVFVGHDEYWTWEMRDAMDDYITNGGHVARFAGNFMWQTRLEDKGRRQVCYKYRARAEDPVYRGGDVTRATNSWEAPEIGRPGAATFGLNATNGIYAGYGGFAPRGVRGFPVYQPEHWAFADTGIYYGDLLGADSHVYGYEVDGLDYEIRGGLPYPTATSGAPDGLQILAVGMATLVEGEAGIFTEDQVAGDEDGRFVAELLYGEATDANLEKVKRGSGMIVNFSRGKGEVFHAGSCEWSAGLLREDPMVERVTKNVLDRYLGKM
ncbi:N,N-dimethylformamidase beta subunit family domain-containing protein [Mesorhizobium sp. WSM4887]|uniref:N,N-dimethylformamidase beta subunit family domain-containing protein n=1 Tax=Mesorhizobium sp. WSM4887 TaxID=3038543 RepID=UPI00241780F1|nr:N,N-dimethylformamidase beta subunit family domain-containing protein [Mesorhizobium sp. WSM4887]MDG4889738.1 hypothetical protein [Mesorhizobium sp. WSM4887]